MKAKKSLGQNFLVDENVISRIIEEIDATSKDLIIEIGSGRGALTKKLINKGCNIIAYEIDKDLKVYLDKIDGLKVIYRDILASNIEDDIKDYMYDNLFIVGNLPYYITTPILEHIINANIKFYKLTIMIQREVALRFMAKVKSKDYGYFTIYLNHYFNIKKVMDVSKYSFNPVPKVDSVVISLEYKDIISDIDEDKFFEFLKKAFKYKRKTLKNNLEHIYNWKKIEEILEKYNIESNVRAEELEEKIFIQIFKNLF